MSLKKKKVEKETALAKAMQVLKADNKKLRDKRTKLDYKSLINDLGDLYIEDYVVRDPSNYKPRSYNKEKQLIDFVKHIYCKYPIPAFLLKIFNKSNSRYHNVLYRNKETEKAELSWHGKDCLEMFLKVASGKSLYKEYSNLFSRREAHIFLNLKNDFEISENYWLTKIISAGGGMKLFGIMRHLLPVSFKADFYNGYIDGAIKFFSKYEKEIDYNTFSDIMDYIMDVVAPDEYKYSYKNTYEYDFKGRTLSSLIKASNAWHKDQLLKEYSKDKRTFPTFHTEINQYEVDNDLWSFEQISNSLALYKEGNAMKHCVSSYSRRCITGECFIFSLSSIVNSRVATIEIRKDGTIVQARGKCNQVPSLKVISLIKKWAYENKINIGQHVF